MFNIPKTIMNNTQVHASGENILVVDDTPANLRLLMTILSNHGYKVRPVPNGPLALKSAQVIPPDLILLDINMPEMSGYEVCKALKADERTSSIPVIFISVKNEIVDKMKAFILGGVDYITKPFQAEEVLARVGIHLKLRQLQQSLQKRNFQLEHEIEERHRAEEEIHQLNKELEHRVQQRTIELEAANKELRDFVYIASHDLKNPLRGISQLAHWLVHDYAAAFDDEGKKMVTLLINRVKRMDKLIDGILEYSHVGHTREKYESIDLNSFVSEIIKNLDPPENIHITIEKELPVVVGNKSSLEQVFHHLLENAVTFLHTSQGRIQIGCIDEGTSWKFWVADNGPGIEKKYYEKIFQIFQTLYPRDEHESTGTGLAVVKKIIDLHHGKIWVESTPKTGSTFFFLLPKNIDNNMKE